MAAAPFLIIVVIAMSILLMVAAVFLVIYFGHPDDRNEAKVPKAIVLFGLWLAFSSVLILPYDVANSRGDGGGMRVDILWQITYISTSCMVSAVIPFAFFFYEADDEAEEGENNPQFGSAVKGTLLMAGFFFVLCGILFSTIGTAQIPVTRIAQGGGTITSIGQAVFPTLSCVSGNGLCATDRFIWEVDVTFPIYIMALLSFIGWFFFTLFVGVGFVALPMDLINDYRTRPVPMDPATYVTTKKELGQRASALLDAGVALQSESRNIGAGSKVSSSEKRRHAQALRSFEASYYLLKRDIEVLKVSYELKGGNPLFYYMEGFFGIIGTGLTLTWFIHIVVFILPPRPVTPFLNTMFIVLEQNVGGFTLFGVVAYAIWSCYLLWCCVKGCFKFGMRLLFIKVYPMELGNTMLNAFLANTWILLLCCVPIIQFCVVSFPYYSRETQIDLLFGTQIKYLKFFRYFYQNSVFIYIIVILMGLTAFYLAVRPRDVAAEIDSKINAVALKHTRGRD